MKRNNIFWVSYSDLMTSLFFIMLVISVVSIGCMQQKINQIKQIVTQNDSLLLALKKSDSLQKIENERLRKLLKLEEIFKPLEDDDDFIYLPSCKKYLVKDFLGIEIFKPNKAQIKQDYVTKTIAIGKKIERFIIDLQVMHPGSSYIVLIEGNTANTFDKEYSKDAKYGYKKSYDRALAVYNLWKMHQISLRSGNIEVMLCGSGFNGLCRDPIEENNKRFSVQIIPKLNNNTNE